MYFAIQKREKGRGGTQKGDYSINNQVLLGHPSLFDHVSL